MLICLVACRFDDFESASIFDAELVPLCLLVDREDLDEPGAELPDCDDLEEPLPLKALPFLFIGIFAFKI